MKKKTKFKDIVGIVKDYVNSEGRFKEVISVQKIVDTATEEEYNGLISEDLLHLMNDIDAENVLLRKRIEIMEQTCKIYDDFLKEQGYTVQDIWKNMKNKEK